LSRVRVTSTGRETDVLLIVLPRCNVLVGTFFLMAVRAERDAATSLAVYRRMSLFLTYYGT
jgi:hypothetical protein